MITRRVTQTRVERPATAPVAALDKPLVRGPGVHDDSEDSEPERVDTVDMDFVVIAALVAAGIYAFSLFVASSNVSRSMLLLEQVRENFTTNSAAI
jgi:hypothetical protein